MNLDRSSVDSLKGVGPALSQKLARIGITTLQDLLFHLPFRYEDRTRLTAIAAAQPGSTAVIEGRIIAASVTFGRRRSLLAYLEDATGRVALRFFHFSNTQQKSLAQGTHLRCFGEFRRGAAGVEMIHPEVASPKQPMPDRLTPVYPTTEGLGQARLRQMVTETIKLMEQGRLLTNLDLGNTGALVMDINEAIKLVHMPPPNADTNALMAGTHPAQQRLVFEELMAHQTSLRLSREDLNREVAASFSPPGARVSKLLTLFGFDLTNAQRRVSEEVAADLARHSPALRLIQGDVGSGKTVIAAMAAVHACENGYQCAFMAPTEILAEQHYITLSGWFEELSLTTIFLTGKVKGKKRTEALSAISDGSADVVIGTHALFQESVTFNKLGLVIVDEQHRFGVNQRLTLKEKGNHPHQLVMTATPIPRTLTMSLYADMDSSIIDELPPGRSPVTTTVLPDSRRGDIVERVLSACEGGAQAYWVCTLIEESEVIESQAAEDTAAQLANVIDGVGLIHGRMSAQVKADTMAAFKAGKIRLLVATTVIEVGVDVPNASLMVIENPERLGLAQLHQLRGRVGRGTQASHCVLLYKAPLSEAGKARLNVMRETTDGFLIAEEDLRIRGPGEVFGLRQSGAVGFRIADLMRDQALIPEVSRVSSMLVKKDRTTCLALVERWMPAAEAFVQV